MKDLDNVRRHRRGVTDYGVISIRCVRMYCDIQSGRDLRCAGQNEGFLLREELDVPRYLGNMARLSRQEIMIIVNQWIGVAGGYLGDFTYRTHREFYPEYCGVEANPDDFEGTTRERFIEVVRSLSSQDQAKVVRGVLDRFPRKQNGAPESRDSKLEMKLISIAERLERSPVVSAPNPAVTSETLERALEDADTLIGTTDAGNAVDRVHTALHAYLIALCDDRAILYPEDASLTHLLKLLRQQHPKLKASGTRPQDVENVLRAMASIIDSLMPVRNKASLAHPNPVLPEPEAHLVINSARTIFHYFDAKLR